MNRIYYVVLFVTMPLIAIAQNGTVKDCQGHVYPVVKIGDQYWMAENLQCTEYDTNSNIAGTKVFGSVKGTNYSALHYFDGRNSVSETSKDMSQKDRDKLGLLYNWNAVMGYTENQDKRGESTDTEYIQGICPNGWHLPDVKEFENLISVCNGESVAGLILKSKSGWYKGSGSKEVRDEYGFSVLPAGCEFEADCFDVGVAGAFWSMTTSNEEQSKNQKAIAFVTLYDGDDLFQENMDIKYGLSVRCVKNSRVDKDTEVKSTYNSSSTRHGLTILTFKKKHGRGKK